jgi:cytochrome c biogenesis protein CcdA
MPLVQAADNKRDWLKTVAVLGVSIVVVTALFGALLGAPASLLAGTVGGRRTMSQIMQTTLIATGALMMVFALGELGLVRRLVPSLPFGPALMNEPRGLNTRSRYRRAIVLGASMAGTFGLTCSKPLYLALLVYVAVIGNMLYGALALGAYGLGLAASLALAGLVLLPAGRAARLNAWLAAREEAFRLVQGFILALVGAMSVAFFWLVYTVPPS